VQIAKEYAVKDARIKVYVNPVQLGDYKNRNQAASYASGKYLKYVDSDDYIYPWGLRILVQSMEQFPDAGFGLCSLPQDDYYNKPFPFELTCKQAYEYHYFGPGLFDSPPLASIIKKEVFEAVNCFNPGRMVGDLELWHRIAQSYKVVLMMDGLVWTRRHANREMRDFRKYFPVYEKIRIHYLTHPHCPLEQKQINQIFRNRVTGLFHLVMYHFLKLHFRHCQEYLNILFINFSRSYKKKAIESI
jgi:glycosyltransferase involved in cell wall biosynthesis